MTSWPLVLIVDDSSTDVQIISEMLNSEYRIKVARNGTSGLSVASKTPAPDLILLDIVMPDMDGFEVYKQLKQTAKTQAIPIIFLTAVHDTSQEARALNLLAADYITKPYSVPVARARIRNTLRTAGNLNAQIAMGQEAPMANSNEPEQAARQSLGKREKEVLALIAEGLTSAAIADELSIAKGTVEVHRENIMRKLGVHNIASLVKLAIRHGLLVP